MPLLNSTLQSPYSRESRAHTTEHTTHEISPDIIPNLASNAVRTLPARIVNRNKSTKQWNCVAQSELLSEGTGGYPSLIHTWPWLLLTAKIVEANNIGNR
jgi:hypothetical protein